MAAAAAGQPKVEEEAFADVFIRGRLGYKADLDRLHLLARVGELKVKSYRPVTPADIVATGTKHHEEARRLIQGLEDTRQPVRHKNLAAKELKHVPLELTSSPLLITLHLGHNLLTSLNPKLFWMPFLTELNLDHNDITDLPNDIEKCIALKSLSIKNNRLSDLPHTFRRVTTLTELALSYNQLKGLSICFGSLVKLKSLWLSHNLLEEMPCDTTVTLQEFDTKTGERVRQFAEGMGGLTSLTELWMENNRVEEFPKDIQRCASLRMINMRRNRLTEIPDFIGKLSSLEILNVVHNCLTKLTPLVFSLPNLHTAILDNNKLNQLSPEVITATALTSLSLNNNPLEAMPSEIALMPNLLHFSSKNAGRSSYGGHLLGGWNRVHTFSAQFSILDRVGLTLTPGTTRPGTSSSKMYPDHDRSNPDELRPRTRAGFRFRPVEYHDRDEEGSRPQTYMVPGGRMPVKEESAYITPPLYLRPPTAPFSTSRPTTSNGRLSGTYINRMTF